MKQRITITDEAMQMVRTKAILQLDESDVKRVKRGWQITVDHETVTRLHRRKVGAETLSDVIVRALRGRVQ